MILKFRSGFLALLSGFFVLGTASFGMAEDGAEMSKTDSLNAASRKFYRIGHSVESILETRRS